MNLKNKTEDKFQYINRTTDVLWKLLDGEPMGNITFWDKYEIHREIIRREKEHK